MARMLPRTLAKTLTTIACHSPGEFGLFWDPDGTMPWKEFYWALQEEPSLRFVRAATIRELLFLGLKLPFVLDGNMLRLAPPCPTPAYPPVTPPERLYHACAGKLYPHLVQYGMRTGSRSFIPLAADKDLALRIGRRRNPQPIVVDILAAEAREAGTVFQLAPPALYLVTALPAAYVVGPQLPDEVRPSRPSPAPTASAPHRTLPALAGSFLVKAEHIAGSDPAGQSAPPERQPQSPGGDWKRRGRKERRKRSV